MSGCSELSVALCCSGLYQFYEFGTARSEKERGKSVSAKPSPAKASLIVQFFGESMLYVVLAFILSLFFVQAGIEFFNDVAGKK